jgi:hypothetical protein
MGYGRLHTHPAEYSVHIAELAASVMEQVAQSLETQGNELQHSLWDFPQDMHIPCRLEAAMVVVKAMVKDGGVTPEYVRDAIPTMVAIITAARFAPAADASTAEEWKP